MSAKIDAEVVRRNVWRWRHDQNKRAVRIQVRRREAKGLAVTATETNRMVTDAELRDIHRESAGFTNGVPL